MHREGIRITESQEKFMKAIEARDRMGIIDALFWGNVNINQYCYVRACTPLALAASKGFPDICKLLIDCHADVNYEDLNSDTALEVAKTPEVFQLLLDSGIEINHQNKVGDTTLMRATRQGNFELCKLLIEAKANLELQNSLGNTAFIFAGGHQQPEICQLLIEANANIYAINNRNVTALSAQIVRRPYMMYNSDLLETPRTTQLILDGTAQLNECEKRSILNWFLIYNRLQQEGRGLSCRDLKVIIARLIQQSLAQDLYDRAIRAGAAELLRRAEERMRPDLIKLPELIRQIEAHLDMNTLQKTVYAQTRSCMIADQKKVLQRNHSKNLLQKNPRIHNLKMLLNQ